MIHAYRKPLDPSTLVIEVPLPEVHPSTDGPYTAELAREGWLVSTNGWGIGYSFRRESVAREAAATLNALVEVDNKV